MADRIPYADKAVNPPIAAHMHAMEARRNFDGGLVTRLRSPT
jgi:hypothetical protein